MSAAAAARNPLSWKTQCGIAAVLAACVLLTRLPSFCRSVLDWDESLYFLMAAAWRAGHLPYTTIWDNKPAGIYAIFAVFQAVFGERVAAMRIASMVFVSITSFTIFKITYACLAPGRFGEAAAGLAGFTFVLCSLSNDGLAANTELFMVCFTSLATLAALSPHCFGGRPLYHGLLTGGLLGAAFMVKYVAVFEAPVIMLLLASRYGGREMVASFAAACAGAALPLAAVIVLYAHAGLLGLWWDDSIAANFRRLAPAVPPGALAAALDLQWRRWGPLFAAAVVALLSAGRRLAAFCRSRKRADLAAPEIFLSFWLLGGLAGVAAAKSFYDHYFLQILPVLCVISGWLAARIWPAGAAWPRYRMVIVLLAFWGLPAAAAYTALADALRPVLAWRQGLPVLQPDPSARIAADLAAMPGPVPASGLKIYVFDGQPIIYALVGQAPPTRYVLPSILTKNFLGRVAGIDAAADVAKILARHPLYIVRDRHPPVNPKTVNQTVYIELDQALAAHYAIWRSYQSMDVYRRLPGRPAG